MNEAADPKHLGAEIGFNAVLHSWHQKLHYHPHIQCIVPGGSISRTGTRWIACRRSFFLPVPVLSRLFRRLFLEELRVAHDASRPGFLGDLAHLAKPEAFAHMLAEVRRRELVVYAKPPFGGPEQVLTYLGRYTHRVAFRWRDYRHGGKTRVMTLDAHEFIHRFLLHALADGFHRIRHYGFLANGHRAAKLELCHRQLTTPRQDDLEPKVESATASAAPPTSGHRCSCCRGPWSRSPPGDAARRRATSGTTPHDHDGRVLHHVRQQSPCASARRHLISRAGQ